jgi:hypothetical protein
MRKTGDPRPPSSQWSEGVLRDAAGDGTREYMHLGRSAHGDRTAANPIVIAGIDGRENH